MPRVAITVTLIDDENRHLVRESWSPLGYEDLGNPNLFVEHPQGFLNSDAERNLMDRLRTSIDRALMVFARRERRRFRPQRAAPIEDFNEAIDSIDPTQVFPVEYMGEFMQPDPEQERLLDVARRIGPHLPHFELTEAQRTALIAAQPMVEDQRAMGSVEPRKKRVRPIKRVSRYKRDPVI